MSFLSSRTRSARQGFGKPVLRQEDPRLLAGQGCYSDDFNLPRQAYACMVRSPHAHARIRRIDANSRFTVKGTDRGVHLFEAAAAALRPDAPETLRGPLAGAGEETMSVPSYPYGTAVCEVEIDPETGTTEIVRYTTVDDVGRAVNPMILHGQTHGASRRASGRRCWSSVATTARPARCNRRRSWTTRCRAPTCSHRLPPRSARCPRHPIPSVCAAGAKAARHRPSAP